VRGSGPAGWAGAARRLGGRGGGSVTVALRARVDPDTHRHTAVSLARIGWGGWREPGQYEGFLATPPWVGGTSRGGVARTWSPRRISRHTRTWPRRCHPGGCKGRAARSGTGLPTGSAIKTDPPGWSMSRNAGATVRARLGRVRQRYVNSGSRSTTLTHRRLTRPRKAPAVAPGFLPNHDPGGSARVRLVANPAGKPWFRRAREAVAAAMRPRASAARGPAGRAAAFCDAGVTGRCAAGR